MPPARPWPAWKHDTLALALLVLATLWLARGWVAQPLARGLGAEIPEHQLVATDPMLSMTFAGWLRFATCELHRNPFRHSLYLFYPHGAAYGRSCDGLLLGGATALLSGVMPLHTAHSAVMVIQLFLAGACFYALAVHCWGRGALATTFALAALASPYMYQRAPIHPNLAGVWVYPLAIWAWLRLRERPTWPRAALWAASFPLLALSSWYVLLSGLLFQAAALLAAVSNPAWRADRRAWTRTLLAAAAGAATVALLALPKLLLGHGRQLYPLAMLAEYGVPLGQYLLPGAESLLGRLAPLRALQAGIGSSFEGQSATLPPWYGLLLLAGLWGQWRTAPTGDPQATARRREWWAMMLLAAGAAFLWSLGPYLHLWHAQAGEHGPRLPLWWLVKLSSAFTVFRTPARMAPLVQVLVLLGAGWGLLRWRDWLAARSRHARPLYAASLAGLLALHAAWCLDIRPLPTFARPSVPAFYEGLGHQPAPASGGAIYDVPVSAYWFPHTVYFQPWHKRPLVNATLYHDAAEPAAYDFARATPARRFFVENNADVATTQTVATLAAPGFFADLHRAGVEYFVLHARHFALLQEIGLLAPQTPALLAQVEAAWATRLVYRDAQIRVYRTGPAAPAEGTR